MRPSSIVVTFLFTDIQGSTRLWQAHPQAMPEALARHHRVVRAALPRQQTLQALIDWSHELLSPPERVVLRRLSVFAGGFTFDAAEAVCAGDAVGRHDVLDLLTQLVNKSLVAAEESAHESRYSMLETVRQYARGRLEESGEATDVGERHLHYFLDLAKEAEPQLLSAEQVRWLERLERELDNIRTALAWSRAHDRVDMGLRLASELWRFGLMRGHAGELREWLQKLLAKGDVASDAVRARALGHTGFVALMDFDAAEAASLATESLASCRRLGDTWGVALSLMILGAVASRADRDRAEHALHESIALFREVGDRWRLGQVLMYLAAAREEHGDLEGAAAPRAENLALFRELGDRRGLGFSLLAMARAAMSGGADERALGLATESLAHFEVTGDEQGVASTLTVLGALKATQGALDEATDLVRRSVGLFHAAGSRTRAAVTLGTLADITVMRRQWRRAAMLYGAVEALSETRAARRPPAALVERERLMDLIRSHLDEATFTSAWQAGHAMTLEQAIHLASSDDAP
jgi:hypothetical protein